MARNPHGAHACSTSTALTLFVLGAMVSLLALLGRVGQELQGRLLVDLWQPLARGAAESHPPLSPMIHGLDTSAQRLVAAGLVVGAVALVAGGTLWLRVGKPALPHERTWTSLGAWTAAWLLIGTLGAAAYPGATVRLALLTISLALGLAGFIGLVFLLLRRALSGT